MRDSKSMDFRKKTPWADWVDRGCPNSNLQVGSQRLSGKRILITGAGGSIGSALAQAAWISEPAGLILLDSSENGLYQMDRRLRDAGSLEHVAVLGSVCDGGLLTEIFERHRPQIVLHAAALKHVPLMEQNPFAAVENNAVGTHCLAEAALEHEAERLVLVSTDKAVDPGSIMGASKRIAELVLLAMAGDSTRMTAVRLCNVLGTQGSVVPLFQEQLTGGGPLTVTHGEASRYFVSMEQAVTAIFEALEFQGEETILVNDPGPAVRIMDLAERMIQRHGGSAAIELTGLRPGDKLSEQMLSGRERAADVDDSASRLRAVVSPSPSGVMLHAAMLDLGAAIRGRNLDSLLRVVGALVPEYRPSGVLEAAVRESVSGEKTSVMQA